MDPNEETTEAAAEVVAEQSPYRHSQLHAVLTLAKSLIENESAWHQGCRAKNANGESCNDDGNSETVSRSMVGAVYRAAATKGELPNPAMTILTLATGEIPLTFWNDMHSFLEVHAAFARAIAIVERAYEVPKI
jgi:hypothetical protein